MVREAPAVEDLTQENGDIEKVIQDVTGADIKELREKLEHYLELLVTQYYAFADMIKVEVSGSFYFLYINYCNQFYILRQKN